MALELDDIAVGVFTSALNLRERALSVQETWLKSFSKGYLIGGWYEDPGLKMIALGEGVGEDYASAHRKQFLGLLELYKRFPEASWYYLTGCDAFVFARNLLDLLTSYDAREELLVGGHCGETLVDGEKLVFPAGGPGFALSRPLVAAIAEVIPSFISEWERDYPSLKSACDVALAFLVKRERGVRVSFAEGFYSAPPYRYPANTYKDGEGRDVNRAVIAKPIAFHYLGIREIYLLDSGTWPTSPGPLARCYDLLAKLVARKLHSRSIINRLSRLLYGRKPRQRGIDIER
jgi:hypothetical protein